MLIILPSAVMDRALHEYLSSRVRGRDEAVTSARAGAGRPRQ